MQNLKDDLKKLYADASKHSVYQNIPAFVSIELGYTETIDEAWRGDHPRLNYLLGSRRPQPGEHWVDFGANTGFFTLSLAREFPDSIFTAIEANPNHADFIASVARHFQLTNVKVVSRAVGIADLNTLPHSDFLLHLNVLHHAGHDFDAGEVPTRNAFPGYAKRYLLALRERADNMLLQIGSNWGGDKNEPIIGARDEIAKIRTFSEWLCASGWTIEATACARHTLDGSVSYQDLPAHLTCAFSQGESPSESTLGEALSTFDFDRFPGEFYRRPLFTCRMK